MSKKVYISGNTANCFNEFTLCCTKDFENKYLTNNSSIVDNEEYFYADFKSVKNIESCYENRIIKLQDEITDLQHRLDVAEKALELCERYHIGFKDATLKEQVGWRETRVKENINYFKEKAEKELKGE
jgi:predicted nuclease with TOPRIM domain